MQFDDLIRATLLRRYKRFLADVELSDGQVLTVHCPNTGAMTGCAQPGSTAWISQSDNAKRKYPHTLELVQTDSGVVSVNTNRANRLVHEAILNNSIAELAGHERVRPEVKIPEGNGRFDFLVEFADTRAWVEVKSATLLPGGVSAQGEGAFPDAVSTRALKHVNALADRVAAGDRGVLIFCAQHCGIERMRLAAEIDADYAAGVRDAIQRGVEVLAYGCSTDLQSMQVERALPFCA